MTHAVNILNLPVEAAGPPQWSDAKLKHAASRNVKDIEAAIFAKSRSLASCRRGSALKSKLRGQIANLKAQLRETAAARHQLAIASMAPDDAARVRRLNRQAADAGLPTVWLGQADAPDGDGAAP